MRVELNQLGTRKTADAGYELQIRALTGDAIEGCVLRILGRDSRAYQQALNAQSEKMRELAAHGKPLTRELRNELELELASSLVVGWPDSFDLNGEPLPFSRPNAGRLLDECPAIREQIEEAASRRANFLSAPASS